MIARRAVLASALAAPLAAPFIRSARADAPVWTRDMFMKAMAESGRPCALSQGAFDAIQARKPAAIARIAEYLKSHLGHADQVVVDAFQTVPREYFHYYYPDHSPTPSDAYEVEPKPWGLGYGSALSDYLGQAYMTQVLGPKPEHTTLEIGTGSGFQTALLSRIVKKAYSNVETRVGDGYFGWPEVDGGFDRIIITCAAQYAPPELFKQLKPGGVALIPIGQPFKRGQFLYVYTKDDQGKIHTRKDVGVFFIPMTGTMMKTPAPTGADAPG
jgi:protein-L-isoaspartate(D-aspartate) O-methyltransferase